MAAVIDQARRRQRRRRVLVATAIVLACAAGAGAFALASGDGGGKHAVVKRASAGSGPLAGGGQVWISSARGQLALACIANTVAGRVRRTPFAAWISVGPAGHRILRLSGGAAPSCR